MRVSLIVEGAYPYVNGGMSSWIQRLMTLMPDVEFIVQCISADRGQKKKFAYKIPDNCIRIEEIYLMDDDYIGSGTQKRFRMSDRIYEAFETLIFGETADWPALINFFNNTDVSLNAILSGEDFLSMALNFYQNQHSRLTFTDFLWSLRSMYLPLFTCMKALTSEVDIYHSASGGYAGIWGCMQKCKYNKPFIMSEHGIYTREREEEIIKADWLQGIYKDLWIKQFRKIGQCCYTYADVVTSLYSDARSFQIELGCDSEKTLITPNGVNPDRFANVPEKDEDDQYINVGALLRIAPIKDVKTLINGFALAKDKEPRLKLWIMGDIDENKEYSAECMMLVSELNVKDVVFTGVIRPEDYIGKMDMMVLSSISEGQPLSILEAFTAKKPFIATNVGNCSGLIEGEFDDYGPAGIVVSIMSPANIANAILKLSKSEDLRRSMGEIGARRAREFYDETDKYGKYMELYKNAMEGEFPKWQE